MFCCSFCCSFVAVAHGKWKFEKRGIGTSCSDILEALGMRYRTVYFAHGVKMCLDAEMHQFDISPWSAGTCLSFCGRKESPCEDFRQSLESPWKALSFDI